MKTEWVAADRAQAVRGAAAAWREAGLASPEVEGAIALRYPDDRVRAAPAMAVLSFVFAAVAGVAVLALAMILVDSPGAALLVAPLLVAAVEWLVGPGRRVRTGIEDGLSLAVVVAAAVAAFWILDKGLGLRGEESLRVLLLIVGALCGLACWRWGMPLWAAPATFLTYLFLASLDGGRWLLLGVSLGLTPVLSHVSRHERLAPSHRLGLALALAVSVLAAYLAINVYSLDEHWVESVRWGGPGEHDWHPLVRLACLAGTALLPLAVMTRAIRTRDQVLLWCGGLMLAASCATVRAYAHLAPTWLLLVLAGGALMAVALLLRRRLASGPGGERGGYTTADLGGGDPRRLAETVAVLATLTPTAAPPRQEGFVPGGGTVGGGGASGEF